jgi:hypothetical protein
LALLDCWNIFSNCNGLPGVLVLLVALCAAAPTMVGPIKAKQPRLRRRCECLALRPSMTGTLSAHSGQTGMTSQ